MNEPKLRFKADDGRQFPEWEEKKIGDITLSHNAGVYIAKDNYGTGTNIIGVGDIYESDVINGKQYRLAPVDSDEYILDEGDLVYGESSLVPEGIARTVCIGAAGKGTAFAWHTRRYKVDRTIINPYFLTLQVNYAKRVRNHLMRVCTRNALTGMTTNEYFGTKISVPSLPEQQKIAEFLSTIDTVIEKQKETVSAWEERKKGVMQKLFSQEVRFKADDGRDFPDWEEKKLGDVCAPLTYGMNAAAVKYDGENKYIRITDIDDESHLYKNDELVSPDGELDDKYLVGENDILLARTGASVGKSYLYDKKDGKLYYAGFLIKAHVESENSRFIFYQTLTDRYARWVQVTSMRSGQPGINANEYSEFMVYVPCLAEQQKIADCLSSLDKVIEKQKATLAAWEELKKGLLQQMFV